MNLFAADVEENATHVHGELQMVFLDPVVDGCMLQFSFSPLCVYLKRIISAYTTVLNS
jgi:hypothetical protein